MDSLGYLKHHRDVVALETFSVATLDVNAMLKNIFPEIKKHFFEFTSRFSANDAPIPLSRDERAFVRLLEKHNYVDIAPLGVYVPEGLNVDYVSFAQALKRGAEHAAKVQDLLNKYTVYLAMLVTNEFQRFETQNSAAVYKGLQEEREEILREIGGCFKQGSHETKRKYDEVVKRNADWPIVFGEIETLGKLTNSVNRNVLNTKVKEATALMEKVINMLREGKMEGSAPEVAQELSDGAYQIASELEFFSVMYYRVLAFVTAVNATTDKVTEVLKG
jgi:hypothetical protein